jgi:hypothetical protein
MYAVPSLILRHDTTAEDLVLRWDRDAVDMA